MLVVLDTMEALKLSYPVGWRTLPYNLYLTEYTIVSDRNHISVVWKNKQCETHSVSFYRFKFKSKFLNRIYFRFVPRLSSTDVNRRHNVLKLVYENFCEETGAIQGNFETADNFSKTIDFMMALIYVRFFSKIIPLAKFLEIFDPTNTKISHEATIAISKFVDYLLANNV